MNTTKGANSPDKPAAPAVTPGITTERDVRNTVTPAPAQGDTPRSLVLSVALSEQDQDAISKFIMDYERELAEAKANINRQARELYSREYAVFEQTTQELATLRQQLVALRQWSEQAREAIQDVRNIMSAYVQGDEEIPPRHINMMLMDADALLATHPAIDSAMKQEGRE